jgi:uncharacterized membrane protein
MRDLFYGLIIGFFIGTLLVNLIKIAFYLSKAIIILLFAILRKIVDMINTYKTQKQEIKN